MKVLQRICAAGIAALLAVPCFPPMQPKADDAPRIVVSLGDSYSSGEGTEPFYGQDKAPADKVLDPDWLAHRSTLAWPGLLTLDGTPLSEHRDESWYFVAASGACLRHLHESFPKYYSLPDDGLEGTADLAPQLAVFEDLPRADYVTLTLGGNDVDFAGVLNSAVSVFGTSDLPAHLDRIWEDFYAEDGIRDEIYRAYYEIAEAAGDAVIIVAGYPHLLKQEGSYMYNAKNSAMVNAAVDQLNAEIEGLVTQCREEGLHIYFAPVTEEFAGHEAYTSDPYINKVTGSQDEDIDRSAAISAYSVHPNAEGARAYARAVQKVIDALEEGRIPGEPLPSPLTVTMETQDTPAPPERP